MDFFSRVAAVERESGRRVGASHPADEPIRFVPSVSLAFAARDLETTDEDHGRAWVTNFLGLAGADGALPPYLGEEIAREDVDHAVRRALLTPFHHRATALLFRSVHRCRVPEESKTRLDPWPTRLVSVVRGDVGHDALERELAIVLAPLLHGAASAASLDRALRVVSLRWLGGAPIQLTERTGARVPIDREARACLGATRLGDTALLGSTVADPSSRATIHVGPVDAGYAAALRPAGHARRALGLVVRWLADTVTVVEVIVRHREAPLRVGAARLGQSALGSHGNRVRERRLDLDATDAASARQALGKDGTTRPPKELACDPIPARSFSV